MASTYTTGFGIEKIGSGEQSGAWGTTTNHNLDILDRIASYKAVALSGSTHTLTVREASPGSGTENLQDGMYRVIKFTGALGANNTVTIAPNTAPAYFIFENATTDSGSSGPYSVILTQGSGANITIQNGKNAIVYCDGAGSGAAVVNALSDLQIATLEVTGVAAIDGALTAAAITGTTLTTSGIVSVDDTTTSTSGTTGSIHTDGGLGVAGTAFVAGAATVGGASQFNSTVTVGVNDTGYDVKLFGATSGKSLLWDESADSLIVTGTTTLVGTTNLDAVDIDGAVQLDSTLTVGVNDTGYDVKFFGDTASAYMLWDTSADDLILGGAAGLSVAGITGLTGNVGVGPSAATTTVANGLAINNATATNFPGLEIQTAGTTRLVLNANNASSFVSAIGNTTLSLFTNSSNRLHILGDGKVGIGVAAPNYLFNVGATTSVSALAGAGITLFTGTGLTSSIGGVLNFRPALGLTVSEIFNLSICAYDHSGDDNADGLSINGYDGISFCTGASSRSESMRIDVSGNLLVGGTTVRGSARLSLDCTANGLEVYVSGNTNAVDFAVFRANSGTLCGHISRVAQTGAVTYNTTSDYRLKNTIAPMTGALAKVAKLKPVTYKWKEGGVDGQGFIAHELQEVVPDAVSGEKDAVDAEGKPKYQGVDTSFVVATLTAAIQEQQALIESLTNRITALEG